MDITVIVDCFEVVIGIVFYIGALFGVIKGVVYKKYFISFFGLCFLVFLVSVTLSMIYGGLPATDAANQYELYEEGHYYLVSHGNYTEVSYDIYQLMEIMQILCFGSVITAILSGFIKNKIETGSFLRYNLNS